MEPTQAIEATKTIPWDQLGVAGVVIFLVVREAFNFALSWRKSQNGGDPMQKAADTFLEAAEVLRETRNGVEDVKQIVVKVKEDTTVIRDRVAR